MVNYLIVFAHEEETSLNAAIKHATVSTLDDLGHTVVVSDLYKLKFHPLLGRNDILGELHKPERFNYGRETLAATREGRICEDIKAEHKKLAKADIIIFQFPMQWSSFPAILKGWFDRIFTQGFAFGPDMMFDKALFKGKKAMLSFTTGGPRGWYTPTGPMGDIEITLWPLQNGILHFVGFDVISPHIMFGIDFAQYDECAKLIEEWKERLKTLHEEKTLSFLRFGDYDPIDPENPMTGFNVKPALVDSTPADRGLTIGQHLGRPLPVGNMYLPAAEEDTTGRKNRILNHV